MIIYLYLACFFFLFYFLIGRNNNYWKSRGVPSDKPFPFFGNLFSVATGKEHLLDRLNAIYRKFDGPYVGIYIFTKPYLMLRSPEMVKKVLVKDADKFLNRNVTTEESGDPIASHLLFSSKDATWKNLRTRLSPVFTSGKMKLMFPLMKECAKDLKDYLDRNEGQKLDLRNVTKRYTVDVISSCAFGINAYCLKNEDSEMMKMANQLFDFRSVKRNLTASCFFFFPLLVRLLKLKFLDTIASDYFINVFKTTMKEREEKKIVRNDLIDLLANLRKNDKPNDNFRFDDLNMAAQAITFFSAGNNTTSSMMSFTFYELALHKDVQDRLRQEIRECFEKHGDVTYESISELKYLDMVFNETLRMYPLTTFLDRQSLVKYTFAENGLTVDKGTAVLIPVGGLHFDPEYFPDPEKFDPERFNDENKRNIVPYSYLPFGEGPRICIGQRFATLVSKIGIANVIKDYAFEPVMETSIPIQYDKSSILLVSKTGIPLKVVKV